MDLIFERHEPASIKKENFSIIKVFSGNKWSFQKAPESIKLINRYLIEKNKSIDFINHLLISYQTYSCIYLSNKSDNLTKIEKYKKTKNLIKYGWTESEVLADLYIKKITFIDKKQINLIEDYCQDSIIIFLGKNNKLSDFARISKEIGLVDMPKSTAYFCLTKKSILNIIDYNISILYKLTSYYEGNANEERDIYVCYSPWKL